MPLRTNLAAGLLLAALLAPTAARADSPADKAAADALFDQGKQLIAAGKYVEACPKLEESQRLDPALGTQLNLADCYEHAGKSASAFGLFNAVARASEKRGDKDRAAEAGRRAGLLAPTLQKLAIVVPPATRFPGLEVRKDGELVGDGSWGSALPTDPGAHTIEASAPGHKAWSTVVRVDTNGGSASVEVPALDVLATPTGETPAPFWTARRIAGVTVAAAGGVSAIVGAVAGGVAISKKGASNAGGHCTAADYCDPTGLALRSAGLDAATVSTATLIAGGIAVAGGLTLALTARSGAPLGAGPATARVSLTVGMGTVRIEGRW